MVDECLRQIAAENQVPIKVEFLSLGHQTFAPAVAAGSALTGGRRNAQIGMISWE
jgi:hypothetical protein